MNPGNRTISCRDRKKYGVSNCALFAINGLKKVVLNYRDPVNHFFTKLDYVKRKKDSKFVLEEKTIKSVEISSKGHLMSERRSFDEEIIFAMK